MPYIAAKLRQEIARRAHYRCEYCQSAERIISGPLHIEHIQPESKGGETVLVNLAYACARCNLHKGNRTHFRDPVSRRRVLLFNPRVQKWSRHFKWSPDYTRIEGRTRTGRATVVALNMNEATIVRSRSLWASLNIHPPR